MIHYIFDFNPRAKRVHEKASFVSGSIQNELEWEGERIDSINMKVIRGEDRATYEESSPP